MPRGRRTRTSRSTTSPNPELSDEDGTPPRKRRSPPGSPDEGDPMDVFRFSQQAPEMSQPIQPVKANERHNFDVMGEERQKKAVTDLSRLLLFKALAGEPIDRLKCAKEANISSARIASVAFEEAAVRLRNVFGFDLRRVPKFMEGSLPTKFKDRLYVTNAIEDDGAGTHSKAIHSVHRGAAVEKGFLMVVLAFIFCKGTPQSDGSRWIADMDLYRLLHGLDESLPKEPPTRKVAPGSTCTNQDSPRVDPLLEKLVQMDYLLRRKDPDRTASSQSDQDVIEYAMGPRAAMEIGRKQVVYFCSEVLDEEPDPTMLAENDDDAQQMSQV